jgi:hypothetical protein
LRSGLAGVGIVALALASCATIPTPQDANDAVLILRKYDTWAWAVGIALICADLVLPVPRTVVIAALGIIYGTVLGGLLGSVGLITGGLLGYVLMLTSARRMVKRFVGPRSLNTMESLFERAGAGAIVLWAGAMVSASRAHARVGREIGGFHPVWQCRCFARWHPMSASHASATGPIALPRDRVGFFVLRVEDAGGRRKQEFFHVPANPIVGARSRRPRLRVD